MMNNFINNLNTKGFFHFLTANYFIGFLGLASQLLVVKFLSPSEMADIKILQSFVAVVSIMAGFGFNTAVLKMCSENISTQEKKEIFSKNIFYTLISMSMVIVLSILLIKLELLSSNQDYNNWLLVYLLIVPATVFTSLFISYLQALKKIRLMASLQSMIRLIGILLIILFTYYYGFSGFVWSNIMVSFFGLIGILIFVRKDFISSIDLVAKKDNLSYAFWSGFANTVGITASYLDIFILNSISDDRITIGYYSIATIFLLGLNYITSTVQSIATPYFSEKSSNEEEFKRVLNKYLKLLIMISILVGAISYFIVPVFVNIFYGDEYQSVGEFFKIFVFKYIFWSTSALVGVAVLSIGKMKFNFLTVLFTTIIAFFITYALGLKFGTYGVAYGQVISYFIAMIFIVVIGRKVINNHFCNIEGIR